MKIHWPSLKLPPINLWNLPFQTYKEKAVKYKEKKVSIGDNKSRILKIATLLKNR